MADRKDQTDTFADSFGTDSYISDAKKQAIDWRTHFDQRDWSTLYNIAFWLSVEDAKELFLLVRPFVPVRQFGH